MARAIEKLSPSTVTKTTTPGMYGDGAGLYLHVGPDAGEKTGKSWIFRYMMDGKQHEMGLGPLHTIGLGKARQLARECREQRLSGINPLAARKQRRDAAKLEASKAVTFRSCATKYIAANRAAWRNAKHAAQWDATLATYVYPVIGNLPVAAVETGHVTKILEPIWVSKAETATRVRGRIESILDFGRAHGWRAGENPARWRGHLQNVLPKTAKIQTIVHHPALPWREIGAFMMTLAKEKGVSALALRYAILTVGRTGEVIGARWSEIDIPAAVWTVPAGRMKAGREHRVPLSEPALATLREASRLREKSHQDGFVFPGGKAGKGLSDTAMSRVLLRLGRSDVTVHGFRSSFRDWAGETGKPDDLAEAALAHIRDDKTQTAYQRGDLLERRQRLMADWAAFCARPTGGDVIDLGTAARAIA
jgi:integrase